MNYLWMFVVPCAVSLVLVPIVKRIAWKLEIYAVENARTVHHGKIARVGGIAVYLAFLVGITVFAKVDDSIRGMLVGGFIVFIGGLLDDMYNLPAKVKLLFQGAGAIAVMWIGNVYLSVLHLPFGITINAHIISALLTFVWIIGITNAINLLDGLDGLSSGFSIIVLLTICLLCTTNHRYDIMPVSLVLAGATMGFLRYNFHPASIFIGDCGAQFLGFMISSISLLGFKGGTFITLAIPITLLFVPITDTLVAIARRKLAGMKFSDPDKNHLHHTLMRTWGLGQRATVLIIYL
ncbi:MAG: undecaprenyl/decaprenyl-phosphate alpha-N-acetylglucosaminyl 1-phosphate transferase, partial [Erysipelotrichaceae bacterium]|nr:undecaprenyl/decaprenyl-phosphate alpha-N-acetylglucosaminyl 1-phosphate transferase [Erysipelotrichaceae bacterium]